MKIKLPVPYGIVFLYDVQNNEVEIPEYSEESLVSVNQNCISVGTIPDVDGETEIQIQKCSDFKDENMLLLFEGVINTPTKKISLCSSDEEGLLQTNTLGFRTEVKVFLNHNKLPDKVIFAIIE